MGATIFATVNICGGIVSAKIFCGFVFAILTNESIIKIKNKPGLYLLQPRLILIQYGEIFGIFNCR